jgi:hypothetical protein
MSRTKQPSDCALSYAGHCNSTALPAWNARSYVRRDLRLLLPFGLPLLLAPLLAACGGRRAQLGTSTMIAAVEWNHSSYA